MSRSRIAALAAALAGCSSVPVTTRAESDAPDRLAAAVLEPVRATGTGDVGALGDRLTSAALASVEGQALVWGAGEVPVLHPERNDWTAVAAIPLLKVAHLRPEEAVLVRARLETAQASSQQEVRGGGSSAVGAAAELRWRATVEVLHPSSGRILVESTAEARVDPFASGAAADATLQAGAVLERAATEALSHLTGHWSPPRESRGPALETWVVVARPEGRLSPGLDAEVQRLGRLQVANAGMDEAEAARLARLPAGVFIRQAPPGARLREGDLVVTIDGAPAGAASLGRARLSPGSVVLEVRSADGRIRRVNFP